jgi:hypothetical protein
MGERRYSSNVLDLGSRWRWVVSFTPRPLYPRGRSPWCRLDRLGWPQSRSGCCGVEKSLLGLPRIEPRPSSPLTHRFADWAVPAPNWLHGSGWNLPSWRCTQYSFKCWWMHRWIGRGHAYLREQLIELMPTQWEPSPTYVYLHLTLIIYYCSATTMFV